MKILAFLYNLEYFGLFRYLKCHYHLLSQDNGHHVGHDEVPSKANLAHALGQ